jgi:serine/threonine-protein kinase RsbW
MVQRPAQTGGVVELRIPNKAEWVAVARLAIAAVANRLPFSMEEIEDLKLAIAEACTNAIQHAVSASSIEIVCEAFPDQLRLTVRDHGNMTASDLAPQAQGEPPESRANLGVFLIRSLMDEVEYTLDPSHGTNLVMVKKVTR